MTPSTCVRVPVPSCYKSGDQVVTYSRDPCHLHVASWLAPYGQNCVKNSGLPNCFLCILIEKTISRTRQDSDVLHVIELDL